MKGLVKKLSAQQYQQVLVLILLLVLAYLLDSELLVLLFGLGACSSGGTGSCSSSGGGTGSCDSGCNSTGCDNCSSDQSGSGGGDVDDPIVAPATSTPFLFLQNKDGDFVPENDVLLAHPRSLCASEVVGKERYESGQIMADTYLFTAADLLIEKKTITIRISEIEPEESFVDVARLHHLVASKPSQIVTNHTHSELMAVSTHDLENNQARLRRCLLNGAPPAHQSYTAKGLQHPVRLKSQDSIVFDFVFEGERECPTLMLGAWYRSASAEDLNHLHYSVDVPSNRRSFLSKLVLPGVLMSGLLGIGGSAMHAQSEHSLLANTFGVQTAFAGTPHNSLYVHVWLPKTEQYEFVGVVQPRHLKLSTIAVTLPAEAVGEDGAVRVKINSTDHHNLDSISLVSKTDDVELVSKELPLTQATHTKATNEGEVLPALAEEKDGCYTQLLPGEKLDLSFSLAALSEFDHTTQLALTMGGFYTPLTVDKRQQVGEWWHQFTAAERKIYEQFVGEKRV